MSRRSDAWLSFTAGATAAMAVLVYGILRGWWG